MDWCEIIVHTTTEGSDIISDELIGLGATGTEVVDRSEVPDPRKPGVYWELYDPKMVDAMPEDVLVKGWFDDTVTVDDVKACMEALKNVDFGINLGTLQVEAQEIANQDWGENWKEQYHPFRIGSHLVIKPTFCDYEKQEGDLVIELDPGMAFGTGTHETTNMCMQLLEKYLTSDMRVMDVGTGSGILAIAAALLGAKDILAVDIDPAAVKVAIENVENNGVANAVRVVVGDLCKDAAMPCDLAVANIVADAVCMLMGPLTRHLEKGGLLICSGIMKTREDDVRAEAEKDGYVFVDRIEMGEWVALAYRNEA